MTQGNYATVPVVDLPHVKKADAIIEPARDKKRWLSVCKSYYNKHTIKFGKLQQITWNEIQCDALSLHVNASSRLALRFWLEGSRCLCYRQPVEHRQLNIHPKMCTNHCRKKYINLTIINSASSKDLLAESFTSIQQDRRFIGRPTQISPAECSIDGASIDVILFFNIKFYGVNRSSWSTLHLKHLK